MTKEQTGIDEKRKSCIELLGETAEDIVRRYCDKRKIDGRVYFYDAVHSIESVVTKIQSKTTEQNKELESLRAVADAVKVIAEKGFSVQIKDVIALEKVYKDYQALAGVGRKE